MRVSVCIDMMFAYCDFYDRFKAVRTCGIDTIEFWKWTNKDVDKVCSLLTENEQCISIFNLDAVNEGLSYDLSRGILNDGRAEDLLAAIKESEPIYRRFNADAMIVLIGENKAYDKHNVKHCLEYVKPYIEEKNINLIVEPLNDIDRKNYSMPYAKPILELLREVNSPNIKMLYDIYHQNMMGDFDMKEIRENIQWIGHFHVADAPGRQEPGTGTVDYVKILREINKLSYKGCIGLEYRASKQDEETLEFLKEVCRDV